MLLLGLLKRAVDALARWNPTCAPGSAEEQCTSSLCSARFIMTYQKKEYVTINAVRAGKGPGHCLCGEGAHCWEGAS